VEIERDTGASTRRRRAGTVLLGVALLVLAGACFLPHPKSKSPTANGASPAADEGGIGGGSGNQPGVGNQQANPNNPGGGNNPAITDPIASARVGNCFSADISGSRVDLHSVSCGPGAYQLIQRYDNSTDGGQCDNLADNDYTVTYPDRRLVFCLTYHYGDDQAAHARLGTCIGQADGSDSWYPYSCQPGTFKVVGRYHGSTDASRCGTSPYYDWNVNTTVSGNSAANLLLCLSFQFGSDAGYARVGNCMIRNGSGSSFTLSFPSGSSCDGTNTVITGRDIKFSDAGAKSFCGNDGYAGQSITRYPQLSYTVCWRPR
jgi:hypothetical protein